MLQLEALLIYLVVINVIAFACFGIDKARAVKHEWRVREATLLTLSLAGGSFGGMLAMHVFRHKTRKPRFRYGLPAMAVVQALLLAWLAFRVLA